MQVMYCFKNKSPLRRLHNRDPTAIRAYDVNVKNKTTQHCLKAHHYAATVVNFAKVTEAAVLPITIQSFKWCENVLHKSRQKFNTV